MLTPSSAARIAAFEVVSLIVTESPEPVTDAMVAMFERAAAFVAGSRIRFSDALTSSASNVEPSWNLTPLRNFKRSSVESALNPQETAKPPRISSFGPSSTKLP